MNFQQKFRAAVAAVLVPALAACTTLDKAVTVLDPNQHHDPGTGLSFNKTSGGVDAPSDGIKACTESNRYAALLAQSSDGPTLPQMIDVGSGTIVMIGDGNRTFNLSQLKRHTGNCVQLIAATTGEDTFTCKFDAGRNMVLTRHGQPPMGIKACFTGNVTPGQEAFINRHGRLQKGAYTPEEPPVIAVDFGPGFGE